MGLHIAISKTPFFLHFHFNQPNNLLVFHAYTFYCTFTTSSQQFQNCAYLTIKLLSQKEIPFLAVWLSRQSVFPMGLPYCHIHDPLLPAIHSSISPNKLLVSYHIYIYIYSKRNSTFQRVLTNVPLSMATFIPNAFLH
jgi:hypothetical protein